jgi:hypothetical protein
MLLNLGLKGLLFALLNNRSMGPTFTVLAAFEDTHHGSLVLGTCPSDPATALSDVHVARLAADKGLVRFYIEQLFERTRVQSKPDAMIQEPCGLMSDAQITSHLAGANTV